MLIPNVLKKFQKSVPIKSYQQIKLLDFQSKLKDGKFLTHFGL